jgi:hypothetical protein
MNSGCPCCTPLGISFCPSLPSPSSCIPPILRTQRSPSRLRPASSIPSWNLPILHWATRARTRPGCWRLSRLWLGLRSRTQCDSSRVCCSEHWFPSARAAACLCCWRVATAAPYVINNMMLTLLIKNRCEDTALCERCSSRQGGVLLDRFVNVRFSLLLAPTLRSFACSSLVTYSVTAIGGLAGVLVRTRVCLALR